ncbi:tyrosine-type recombinase/integrase [Clostridium sp.]|jgi:integrase/recombinase XerD|uniref:tyrosine-type recombinase/integrase n=1 Tax=Clostridium sp. TaxID=1506 RepID=UPI003EE8F867
MGINNNDDIKKWNWEMDEKTENIYKNLCNQIETVFRHKRECSFKTRDRYADGVKHFAKYVAEEYKKQNLNNIKPMHLEGYVQAMQELGYSTSYVTTNLSAVRYFNDANGKDSKRLPTNKKIGVVTRGKDERIGSNKAWNNEEIENFISYGTQVGQVRYGQMVLLSSQMGFRIHEVTRLDKGHLEQGLKEGVISIKGKGGLIRDVPVGDKSLIKTLYDQTPKGAKVFVHKNEQTHQVIKNIQVFIYNNQNKFATGEKQLTFHGLRHFYAQKRYKNFISSGYSEEKAKRKVAKELGHFRPEITDIYIKETP